jgi:hypothetical protein
VNRQRSDASIESLWRKPANGSEEEAKHMNTNAQWILLAGADAGALLAVVVWFLLFLYHSQFDTKM